VLGPNIWKMVGDRVLVTYNGAHIGNGIQRIEWSLIDDVT